GRVLRSSTCPRARSRHLVSWRGRHRQPRTRGRAGGIPRARATNGVSCSRRARETPRPGNRGREPAGRGRASGMNPYHRYVSELARLLREGRGFPLGGFPIPPRAPLADDAPRALIFSPHPDDECIIGGLALRLMREAGMRIVNVAVTQGSNKARQAARLEELEAACEYLGFDLLQTAPDGLE